MSDLRLRHGPGTAARAAAGEFAARLAEVLGVAVVPERATEASPGPGAWRLVPVAELTPEDLAAPDAVLLPARRDARWSLEDMAGRTLEDLPDGGSVVVPDAMGAGLLATARPDLHPLRAGAFPAPEETPVLAAGPYLDRTRATPLPVSRFVPAPGVGLWGLLPPAGESVAAAAREALDDTAARVATLAERAFLEALGATPSAEGLALHVRPGPAPILFHLHARRFRPGRDPLVLDADLPRDHARQFAAGFGRHWAEMRTKGEETA